jgi:hypothetical protein
MRAPEATALALTHRIEALASALRAAHVDPRVSERLLGSAAVAAMDALALELILAGRPAPAVAARAPAEPATPVRLAA